MLSRHSQPPSSSRIFNQANGKRRKIRKGTFSCWECKRRKIRCRFSAASSTSCMNCERFGVPCISQDAEEPTADSLVENEERLVRIETLVSELQNQRIARKRRDDQPAQSSRPFEFEVRESPSGCTVRRCVNFPSASTTVIDNAVQGPIIPRTVTEDINSRCTSLYDYLQSIAPSSATAELIITHGRSPFAVLEQPSKVAGIVSADVSCSPTRRPLMLAQGLLHLALCLQRINLSSITAPGIRLEAPTAVMARRFVDAARQVTSRDALSISHEGLETLMLESSFETSAGNLQAAWLNIRRALSLGQLMHPYQRVSQLRDPGQLIWGRLVLFDRILSLMLGLAFDPSTSKRAVPDEERSTSLERRHTAICERIISRNLRMQERIHGECDLSDSYDDYEATKVIDHELKQALRSIPSEQWNVLCVPTTAAETAVFADQLHHYDLLVLTHQPYLIHGPHRQSFMDPNGSLAWSVQFEYSKFAALTASREVLARVLLCCRNRHIPCSTSGLIHKAFNSSTSLLLAHTEGHALGRDNVLEHQRPADLMMISDIIDHMDEISRLSGGNQYFNSEILKELLKIEQDAANGSTYITSTARDQEQHGAGGEDVCLQFSRPYLGTVSVKRQQIDAFRPIEHNMWTEPLSDW